MNWAPLARIILRYVAGAGIMGSTTLGNQLAADPDLVLYLSLGLAAVVEAAYAYSKRRGWAT
jgi:preprotein translocase subunit Sec61beta